MTFEVNEPAVVEEMIEGEVVAVHLESGNYYSLTDESCRIWNWLKQGFSSENVIQHLLTECETDEATARKAVDDFVQELLTEGLIRERSAPVTQTNGAISNGTKRAFQAPQLQKYSDMQELLLLDPVHEVGAAGWPHPAPDSK